MELVESIKSRRSIRKFKSDPVPDEDIKELLEAARLAPSGTNLQPWRFVVVKGEDFKSKLSESTPLPFVTKAPVIIVCCIDTTAMNTVGERVEELREAGAFLDTPLDNKDNDRGSKRRSLEEDKAQAYMALNAAIAIDHITLRAVDLGLGTCWVMMFDQHKVKNALELEDKYHVIALIPVGYPDQAPPPRPRLNLDDLVIKEL